MAKVHYVEGVAIHNGPEPCAGICKDVGDASVGEPGRGPQDALDALCVAIEKGRVNWIADADIQNFFGSVSQSWLVRFLTHRIGDKRIVPPDPEMVEGGHTQRRCRTVDDRGTGQGSVISPLLGNIYLRRNGLGGRARDLRGIGSRWRLVPGLATGASLD